MENSDFIALAAFFVSTVSAYFSVKIFCFNSKVKCTEIRASLQIRILSAKGRLEAFESKFRKLELIAAEKENSFTQHEEIFDAVESSISTLKDRLAKIKDLKNHKIIDEYASFSEGISNAEVLLSRLDELMSGLNQKVVEYNPVSPKTANQS